jgi:hypothetical protein
MKRDGWMDGWRGKSGGFRDKNRIRRRGRKKGINTVTHAEEKSIEEINRCSIRSRIEIEKENGRDS